MYLILHSKLHSYVTTLFVRQPWLDRVCWRVTSAMQPITNCLVCSRYCIHSNTILGWWVLLQKCITWGKITLQQNSIVCKVQDKETFLKVLYLNLHIILEPLFDKIQPKEILFYPQNCTTNSLKWRQKLYLWQMFRVKFLPKPWQFDTSPRFRIIVTQTVWVLG